MSFFAHLVVASRGHSDTVVGGLEESICPPLQSIPNVDGDAALYGIQGRPVLGCRDRIPDVADLLQIWVGVDVLAGRNLQANVPFGSTELCVTWSGCAHQLKLRLKAL